MKAIKPWVEFCERVLRFKYPERETPMAPTLFFKKFIVDHTFIVLVVALFVTVALQPFSSAELAEASAVILARVVFWILLLELVIIGVKTIFRKNSKR